MNRKEFEQLDNLRKEITKLEPGIYGECMYTLIVRLYKFILVLELRIKIMSAEEFDNFIRNLDFEQKVYAILLRYS